MTSHSREVQTSSKTDEHYTPKHIVQLALDFFREIDLDPASNSKESPNVPAKEVFTSWDDGLTKTWGPSPKKIWLNPPYSQNKQWAAKVVSEWGEGHIKEIVLLLPVRLGVGWFKTYLRLNPIILPIEGRLKFGNNNSSAPFESMLLYAGDNPQGFVYTFESVASAVFISHAVGNVREALEYC